MRNKPPYPLESVDNALRLLQLLRDQGRLRVTEAAEELGTARSTAHRLLSMLVYRDFAVQDDDRGYLPGPALAAPPVAGRPFQQLRRVLLPYMEALCERVGETVNLMIRVGTQTRFLASVESTRVLHVGDRQGAILPACKTSGGKALLARLSTAELAELYLRDGRGNGRDQPGNGRDRPGNGRGQPGNADATMSHAEFDRLCRVLDAVRWRGYALNLEESEAWVCAIGRCLIDGSGEARGALSISIPSARFTADVVEPFVRELRNTAERAAPALNQLPEP